MRSRREIAFRLRQEALNAWFAWRQPEARIEARSPLAGLPDPAEVAAALRGSSYEQEILTLAAHILERQIPLFDGYLAVGRDIRWRRDHGHAIETPLAYFRRVPYLDPARAGDHKAIWELNRHQYLVVLAQAHLLRPDARYLAEIQAQLESWWKENPFQYGINWTSALEVAFRALSWIWIFHFAGQHFDAAFQRRFLSSLAQHGLHLERNLSIYFSPNTHLLGEALALEALGRLIPEFPRAQTWARTGGDIVRAAIERQVFDDGVYFEQSAYYHVYATDMFLFHAVLGEQDAAYLERLRRMAEYLDTLSGPSRLLPLFGDDDGGRLFHPYGNRAEFVRGTLAACGVFFERPDWISAADDVQPFACWWLGARALAHPIAPHAPFASRVFENSGMAVLYRDDLHVLFDGGPFGFGSGGHSHSDTLSVVVRKGAREILLDPGAYTYVGDPEWRNRFRGSAFHNTVRIDALDQADPATPFSWRNPPRVKVRAFSAHAATAECTYRGLTHTRTVELEAGNRIIVSDDITGPAGEHQLEWFWHFGVPQEEAEKLVSIDPRLSHAWEHGGQYGWTSPVMSQRREGLVLRAYIRENLPARHQSVFQF